IAAAVFLNLDAGASFRRRLIQWRQDYYGGPRLMVWRDSLPLIPARWLVGYGPGAFPHEFPRGPSAALSWAYPEYFHESPHNLLLDTAISQGLPGILWLVGLVYLAAFGPSRLWKASAAASFVCLLFLTVTIPGMLMFCVATGAMVAEQAPKA